MQARYGLMYERANQIANLTFKAVKSTGVGQRPRGHGFLKSDAEPTVSLAEQDKC